MRVVKYFAPAEDASSFYRAQGVFPYIKENGLVLDDISHSNCSWVTMVGAHSIVLQRPFNESHVAIMQQSHMMGLKVICDFDDLLTEVPQHNPAYDIYQSNQKNILKLLREADEIWVSTTGLYDAYVKYNKNIYVIPNAHNDYLFPLSGKKKLDITNKKVVYRGGSTHRLDLYSKGSDLALCADYNKDWDFFYLGAEDNYEFIKLNERNHNVFVTNKVPLIQYLNHLQKLNAPVMINPLEYHNLNISKSNISWIEGTYSGSAFFTNTKLPEFNHPFIGDLGQFLNSTGKYLSNDRLLTEMNDDSWQFIIDHLLLSDNNRLRIDRLLA